MQVEGSQKDPNALDPENVTNTDDSVINTPNALDPENVTNTDDSVIDTPNASDPENETNNDDLTTESLDTIGDSTSINKTFDQDEYLSSLNTRELVAELQANPEAYIGKRFTYVSQRSGVPREYEFAGLNKNGNIQLAQVGNRLFRFAVKVANIIHLAYNKNTPHQENKRTEDIQNITGERVAAVLT
jgi:hypothetical protein